MMRWHLLQVFFAKRCRSTRATPRVVAFVLAEPFMWLRHLAGNPAPPAQHFFTAIRCSIGSRVAARSPASEVGAEWS